LVSIAYRCHRPASVVIRGEGFGVDLVLRLGPDVVGVAKGASCSDRTWYAVFHPAPNMPPRVREYIAFSEGWHDRLRSGNPYSVDEFDPWADIHASLEWRACGPGERVWPVEGPVFIHGEVTWGGGPDAAPVAVSDPGTTAFPGT
jgi:hypothetical protein